MLALAILLAVFPSVLVFAVVYKFDTIEKEPTSLLIKLFIGGIIAFSLAMLLGGLGRMGLQSIYTGKSLMLFQFVDSFLLEALPEQVFIFLVICLFTWKDKEFNYTFDAVVYAVTTALGVTIAGNLMHIFRGNGFKVSYLLLSLVGHVISAVFMGYFYGKAKNSEGLKETGATRMYLVETLLIPIVMFGIYDFCLQIQTQFFYVFLILYEIVCGIITVVEIVYLSKHDTMLTGLADVELTEQEAASFKETERW